MSSLLEEAHAAFRRWRDLNADASAPSVAVYLKDREKPLYFSGLALISADNHSFAVSGSGFPLPIHVIRDEDVDRIEIGPIEESRAGFRAGDG